MPSRRRLLPSLLATLLVAGVITQAASCALEQFGSEPPSTTMPCADNTNCDDKDQCTVNECGGNKTCEFKPIDGLAPEQEAGDCKQGSCAAGVLTQINDDTDLPDDLESCTMDSCDNGVKVHEPLPDGSPCTFGELAGLCKVGKCTVECSPQKPCNDGNPCTEDTCNASTGSCTFAPLDGLPTPGFTAVEGDCSQQICVNGENTPVADDADLPPSDICKKGACSMGTPSYTPINLGTGCNPDGTGSCDANGSCLECAEPEDCPLPGTGCKLRTCTNNKCGEMLVAAGTEVPSPDGDCKKLVCDGAGAETVANDDADTLNDNNPCTVDSCVNGMPTTEFASMETSCGAGTQKCNGSGQCTGCTMDSDCGPTNDCITSTCNANQQCIITYTPAATETTINPMQVPDDCHILKCDGMGNVVMLVQADDAPDDMNDCTIELCNLQGMVTTTFAAPNAMCNQNGGTACDGAGMCLGALGIACADGTVCASGLCIDGVCCGSTCTTECMACNVPASLGTCTNVPANSDDAPLCTATNSCDGMGACKRDNGQPCGMNGECSSGFCADGVCCTSACNETCKSCNLTGSVGTCAFVPAATVDPTGMPACNHPYRCDGNGACKAFNGVTCTSASECQSGNCVDGYCCGSTCASLCRACSEALTGASNGTCGSILNGTDPQNECPSGECNGSGACTGGGGGQANGTGCTSAGQCQSGFCIDGVCCNAACTESCKTCNLMGQAGTCVNVPNNTQDPTGTTPCTSPYRCDGNGACKGLNGASCTMSAQCLGGNCVDGFCCNNACTDICKSCSAALSVGTNGTCSNTKAGTDPDNECATGDCNGMGMCTP